MPTSHSSSVAALLHPRATDSWPGGLLLQSCKQICRAKAAEPEVMMGQAWPLALARLLSGGGDKGQFAAALGRWRASLPAIPGADVIFSCRSGAAGELEQDERGADILSPGPAVASLVTVSLLVLPGGQKSFLA